MTDWLQIDEDGEISVAEIMRQIQMHAAQQKIKASGLDAEFDGTFNQALYDALIEAVQANAGLHVELQLTTTPIPVLGRVIDRLRRSLHGLVLFYTNQNTARQSALNKQLFAAMAALIQDLEQRESQHQADIATLQEKVAQLEDALAKAKVG